LVHHDDLVTHLEKGAETCGIAVHTINYGIGIELGEIELAKYTVGPITQADDCMIS
jgi:hypothetical protein